MKTLAEALQSFENTVKLREKNNQTSSDGSEMTASSDHIPSPLPTIDQRAEHLQAASAKTRSVEQPSPKPQKTSALSDAEKLELLSFVNTSFNVLDTFGKTADQLKETAKMFVMLLEKYEMKRIREAFMTYMARHTTMPKPADIINIIDPPPPPPWKPDWAYYVSIKDKIKRGAFISRYSDESEYMERCEKWSRDGLKTYDEIMESREQIASLEQKIMLEDYSDSEAL